MVEKFVKNKGEPDNTVDFVSHFIRSIQKNKTIKNRFTSNVLLVVRW